MGRHPILTESLLKTGEAFRRTASLDIERSSFNTLSSMKDHLDRGRLLLISVDDFGDPAVDHSIVATEYSSNSLYIQNGWSRNRIMYSYSSLDIAQYVYISPLPW